MSANALYRYRILKTYSLLVDFDGDTDRENVPSPVDGETFKQWKRRVLGDSVSNVVVFSPSSPSSQTKMTTLQKTASAATIERVFKAFDKDKASKKVVAVNKAVSRTEHQFSTFPKNVLEDILAETDHDLEPSVIEFFDRLNADIADDIDIHQLLVRLINTYNDSVRFVRGNS